MTFEQRHRPFLRWFDTHFACIWLKLMFERSAETKAAHIQSYWSRCFKCFWGSCKKCVNFVLIFIKSIDFAGDEKKFNANIAQNASHTQLNLIESGYFVGCVFFVSYAVEHTFWTLSPCIKCLRLSIRKSSTCWQSKGMRLMGMAHSFSQPMG